MIKVARYGCPERIAVIRQDVPQYTREGRYVHGTILLDVPLQTISKPESAEAAKARLWFYTGSPFGAEILALARERCLLA